VVRTVVLCLLVTSCTTTSPTPAAEAKPVVDVPTARPEPAAPVPQAAPSSSALACLSAEADAQARHPGAKPGESFDLDGNGKPDPVFKSCYSGNCNYLLYQDAEPCPRFLGEITGSVVDDPRCDKPAVDGQPCRISLTRFMIHGDQQEYFYEFVDGKYVEAGAGRYSPPPPKHP
jgi:hypothetical protein